MRYSFFIIFLIILNQICGAGIINVPGDSATIQSGINGASEGDTVFIAPDIYYERIEIDKPISLIGSDWQSCIIYGMQTGAVVLISSNSVKVKLMSVVGG